MSEIEARAGSDWPLGAVTLRVADLERVASFYRDALGLVEVEGAPGDGGADVPASARGGDADALAPAATGDGDADALALAAPGAGRPLVVLVEAPEAPPRPAGTTGLFHLAILVPSRAELARSLARLIASGRRLSGASDHLVSEALYLNDPEGNGIEIYRDRPREEWSWSDSGELRMATLPLDLDSLLSEVDRSEAERPLANETRLGHVHLNVADLDESESFYVGELGFEVTTRSYPGALFVGRDGYHHHFGLNTWNGQGAPPPPPGSRGLIEVELALARGGAPSAPRDPSGIALRLTG